MAHRRGASDIYEMSTDKLTAVILAGGFGTRLRPVVGDRPKPMALIRGKPFLEYLLAYLRNSGVVSHVVLSVGYRYEQIQSFFKNRFIDIPISYSIEDTPLGTGGAALKAIAAIPDNDFLLVNGDTMFPIDIKHLMTEHTKLHADVTIALKPMRHTDRYGTVVCREGRIISFEEKQAIEEGLINGGIYIIHKQALVKYASAEVFSLEKDFLRVYVAALNMIGMPFHDYFIDIGIPEDFKRAQREL
jgi:D-glycero-alpha-D-manno-heptose 1-phosphate guanylyltransferase